MAPDELPLRGELYSVDQLERHARAIAGTHQLAEGKATDRLLPRLADNERVLVEAYDLVTKASELSRRISPAAEWLLDNFYLIEEQIRATRRLLPRSFSGELPRLSNGPSANYPRAYAISLELISHTDGRVDATTLDGFVAAYQTVVPLKLGELWALPLMLRLALVENLRRVAARIAQSRRDRDLAAEWAQRMIQVVEQSPTDLVLVLADLARAKPSLSGAFVAELTRHLQGQNPSTAFANSWLEHRLGDQGQTTELLVSAEGQAQAADQASVGNSIAGLRFLSVHDWPKFVSEQSLVEKTLCGDPAGIYVAMDFTTRDRYRHAVEAIAKRSQRSEYDVAHRAVQLAQAEAIDGTTSRTAHVGYFLIDRGRPALERMVEMRLTPWVVIEKVRRAYPLSIYLSVAFAITTVTITVALLGSWESLNPWLWLLMALPGLLCAAQLGLAVTNWLTSTLMHPQPLPRMDFRKEIPPDCRTLVVIPTMLSSLASIDRLLEGIEIRFLSNREGGLHFALLTDFEDASEQTTPHDEALVRAVVEGIERLNQTYSAEREDIFFLLHRDRRWNQHENTWMGYERKRGKLADLNATLRGAAGRFAVVVGRLPILATTRYVITLDTDTQLPPDSAREMIEAMAHPLNRPVLDANARRVVAGYTILQPRVGVSLPSSRRSWFVRLFGGDPGVDPYTRVVSDVYQDMFGEGSFIGKGIYDVDSFEQRCGNFPENAILSHDLLESCYCRSALLSDVILYEDYPSSYLSDVGRRHRWMRGDWQIAAWLFPRVRGLVGANVGNPISALSWWKIFDNLRRSLVPPAMLALLVISWLIGSEATVYAATALILAVVFLPSLLSASNALVSKPIDLPVWTHVSTTLLGLGGPLAQGLFSLVMIPFEAYLSVDAIVRTLIRVHWTKRKLLEWKTSSDADRTARSDLVGFCRSMAIAPTIALAVTGYLLVIRPNLLLPAIPLLALWFLSPAIAWYLSRSITKRADRLTDAQHLFLRQMSRKSWRYFETYVSSAENWLPPDNVQFNSAETIAPRTSPTNIGMALLSDLAAYDFGYLPAAQLIERTRNTFATLAQMERYRGHFYNWYDTHTLAPLWPRYVSTVDSGNLAAQLRVLASGFRSFVDTAILPRDIYAGLRDTLAVLADEAKVNGRGSGDHHIGGDILRRIDRQIEELERQSYALAPAAAVLPRLIALGGELQVALARHPEMVWWARAVERAATDHLDDLRRLAAWTTLPTPPKGMWVQGSPEQIQRFAQLNDRLTQLDASPTLGEIARLPETLSPLIDAIATDLVTTDSVPSTEWLGQLRSAVMDSSSDAAERIRALEQLALQCHEFSEMDFEFLYRPSRELFAIGYNVSENRLDAGCYDLLASEARLASYLLIAQGDLGQKHWFALGRLLTSTGGAPALLSWSGSMFEYLMPLLVMPTYEGTLLDQTYQAVVRRQMIYGRQRAVPWGISESGFSSVDVQSNYQYRAFGVPGLGLKRGLAEDLVIAPYASAMALMVAPTAACRNLERLASDGYVGAFGFYEAIDYTPSRVPPGATSSTVRQFMAHHVGMSLLSLAYVLLNKPMQRRFAADPMLKAADLLLHERVPKATVPVFPHAAEANAKRTVTPEQAGTMRVYSDPSGPVPEVHLLSNGKYHLMVTSAGGGYSRWGDVSVTRWREDPTRDCWGAFCYLRDLDNGALWSTTWHPTAKAPQSYAVTFSQSRAAYRRRDEQIETHTQVSVSSEDDLELRRITLTNWSDRPRRIEITSYAEVVLTTQPQDESHPAFSNLFVQTEILKQRNAILCTRRARSAEEQPPWLLHMMTTTGKVLGEVSFESDRTKFVGRGRDLTFPMAFDKTGSLSNSDGSTLDPVVSVRCSLLIQPNESVQVDVVSGMAETRAAVVAMGEKYRDPTLADRVFELAWTRGLIMLQQLNASETDAQAYGRLAGSIVFASALRRAKASLLVRNRRGQSGLWGYGISGDLPIVLVRIRDSEKIDLIRQTVKAHAYWRMQGLHVDLVIWNEDDSVYRQSLQDSIMDIVATSPEATLVDRPGGIFVRRGEQMSEEDRWLLQTVARVVLLDDGGTLIEQVERRGRSEVTIPSLKPLKRRHDTIIPAEPPSRDLAYFNGLGGFSRDGREYVSILGDKKVTPAPWVNVIANAQIGTVVSESGNAYTWVDNSHEFRLTPWHNDPVSDTCGEAIYIRDEETGRFWSPSPSPARGSNTYIARHGFGYSIFDYSDDGIVTELCVYVAIDSPVKFARLKITNHSGRPRQLSVTGYWEWVLGELRTKTAMHVTTELDSVTGAIFARNPYSPDFAQKVAFVDCSETTRTYTGDRTEFLGRNGNLAQPAAMRRVRLSNRTGAGLDPCAAMQTQVPLDVGQERVVVFSIGAASSEVEARQLVQSTHGEGKAQRALEGVWHYWSQTLGAVHFETPDPTVNFLANGWLIYQTLACRMWARTGFYQSGGAYGFRDQLQDAMALIHADPGLFRKHLLCAAGHQFREGDVQHWWHPPGSRGVRTHFSDDYLWLPLAICRYVQTTGDTGVLEERIPFLDSRPLHQDEEANYDQPRISDDVASLYQHAIRAIDHGLTFGAHGLPLMGCGDWNDGMNRVGQHGQGESVWLAFFLYDVLMQFSRLAQKQGDDATADRYTIEAGRLRGHIEQNGWDGEWYRRAYFDDGTPLGSHENPECRIDSISQSWSVLSGAGTNERSALAMENVDRHLVRRKARLIQLLDPPFDKSQLNPGYIKGYVPGVRENGGQYTHAAIWTAMAFAALGDMKRAWELFELINPINHGSTSQSIATYRVEPYVMAADVYGVEPHIGRGGWTWYTGSSGWMYRLLTESLLGLRLEVDTLHFTPRLPSKWPSFKVHYRFHESVYHITIHNSGSGDAIQRLTLDGIDLAEQCLRMVSDGRSHQVEIVLAEAVGMPDKVLLPAD